MSEAIEHMLILRIDDLKEEVARLKKHRDLTADYEELEGAEGMNHDGQGGPNAREVALRKWKDRLLEEVATLKTHQDLRIADYEEQVAYLESTLAQEREALDRVSAKYLDALATITSLEDDLEYGLGDRLYDL